MRNIRPKWAWLGEWAMFCPPGALQQGVRAFHTPRSSDVNAFGRWRPIASVLLRAACHYAGVVQSGYTPDVVCQNLIFYHYQTWPFHVIFHWPDSLSTGAVNDSAVGSVRPRGRGQLCIIDTAGRREVGLVKRSTHAPAETLAVEYTYIHTSSSLIAHRTI